MGDGEKERGSTVDDSEVVSPQQALSPDEKAAIEARNALLQHDKMVELAEASFRSGKFKLRPSTLQALQEVAVHDLVLFPGTFRKRAIFIDGAKHQPPEARECLALIEEMCDYVNEQWATSTPMHLCAYVMWRLNWIHPFDDGNGRTSRSASYLVLCAKLGYLLPGRKSVPERIAANKFPYYAALEAADAAWKDGNVDVTAMEKLLGDYLAEQLVEVHGAATGQDHAADAADLKGWPNDPE